MFKGIRLRTVAAVAAISLGLGLSGATLAGCGSLDGSPQAQLAAMEAPAYPTYGGGQAYCPYVITVRECAHSGILPAYWVQFPASYPLVGDPYYARDVYLFGYEAEWAPWFASTSYYDYYVPASYRHTYVTRVTVFDRTNDRYIQHYHAAYIKASHWKVGSRTLTGTQVEGGNYVVAPNGGTRGKLCSLVTGPVKAVTATLTAYHRVHPIKRIKAKLKGLGKPKPSSSSNAGGGRNTGHRTNYASVAC